VANQDLLPFQSERGKKEEGTRELSIILRGDRSNEGGGGGGMGGEKKGNP